MRLSSNWDFRYNRGMTTGVSFLPGVELGPRVWADRADLRFAFSRSSGPGGQNVNKVNSKTELRVALAAVHGMSDRAKGRLRKIAGRKLLPDGDLLITSETERTQDANRHSCMRKLRELIVEAQVEPKVRRKTKPTRGSKERRLDSKRVRSTVKRGRSAVGE
jgi:ribosome-associated protein